MTLICSFFFIVTVENIVHSNRYVAGNKITTILVIAKFVRQDNTFRKNMEQNKDFNTHLKFSGNEYLYN